jgi:methionyl-tRNA synthetase
MEEIKKDIKKETNKISYEDFAKVEIKAGKILSAEKIPDTDKLLKLMVDFGETEEKIDEQGAKIVTPKPRQIVSGISAYFPDPLILIGKTCMFVTNLEPRMIKGYESNGMLFALSTADGKFSMLEPNESIPIGTKAK